jgi:glutamyl/glutaminyl-tRNA synthetase
MKERATYIGDLLEMGYYFFEDIKTYDNETIKKKYNKESRAKLNGLINILNDVSDFKTLNLESIVKQFAADNGIKTGELMPVLRLALAGTMQGPPVFDMMNLLGKERSIARLEKSFSYFDNI